MFIDDSLKNKFKAFSKKKKMTTNNDFSKSQNFGKINKIWNRKLKFQKNDLCEVMKICQHK